MKEKSTNTRVGVTNANAKKTVSSRNATAKSKINVTNADAKKTVSTTNASAKNLDNLKKPTEKKKAKPRGKPFVKGDERRAPGFEERVQDRNVHGQRNKEAVELTTEMRNLYVKVFNEEYENTGMSNLEFGVRRQVGEGVKGDNDAWEAAVNRTWGRSSQPIEVRKNDEDDDFEERMEILFANGAPTVQARDAEIWRIVKNAQKREREAKKAAKENIDKGDLK
jgi:hypothetical protein